MYDFLKKVPLFEGLPDEDFDRLCELVEIEMNQAAFSAVADQQQALASLGLREK